MFYQFSVFFESLVNVVLRWAAKNEKVKQIINYINPSFYTPNSNKKSKL